MKRKRYIEAVLVIIPIIILLFMLIFANHAVRYFKNVAYSFVYDTNVGSVQRFSKELEILTSKGYTRESYHGLYKDMIRVYNKTMGEKDGIVTFLIDADGVVYHSNPKDKENLAPLLNKPENAETVKNAVRTAEKGEVTLRNSDVKETMYYHKVSDRDEDYWIFVGINREKVESKLNANEIVLPICIIALLLLFVTEYAVWLKFYCSFSHGGRKKKKE